MAASTEQSELVAEEMQLRKELSMARQELVNKKHTLEILQKERDAFKSQLPDALMQQKKDIDAEIAELRSQLKDAKGGVIVPPETNRVGSYAGLAASPGKPAAAGWGALINDAKSTPLPSSSSATPLKRTAFREQQQQQQSNLLALSDNQHTSALSAPLELGSTFTFGSNSTTVATSILALEN